MCQICNDNYNYCPACGKDETEDAICPECYGKKTFVSDCCGEPMIFGTHCSKCLDICESGEIICDTCKGEGIVQQLIEAR